MYDPNPALAMRLIETESNDPTYSDGDDFDITTDYKIESNNLKGPCEYLKASVRYELRDTKCEVERAFICKWTGNKTNEELITQLCAV